jgi:phage terminase Nu1 subunit (DNA packaging protein)
MSAEPPIDWTLFRAAQEFGLHRDTLKKRLLAVGASPNDAGGFSTQQICAAVYGDYQGEKTRLAKEQADKTALDNAERRRELIRVEDALEIVQRFCYAVRQKFLATKLSDEEKNSVLKEIQRLADCDVSEAPESDEENEA